MFLQGTFVLKGVQYDAVKVGIKDVKVQFCYTSALWNVYAHMLFYECVFYCIFDILLNSVNIFGW
jgi:hypothetical protein